MCAAPAKATRKRTRLLFEEDADEEGVSAGPAAKRPATEESVNTLLSLGADSAIPEPVSDTGIVVDVPGSFAMAPTASELVPVCGVDAAAAEAFANRIKEVFETTLGLKQTTDPPQEATLGSSDRVLLAPARLMPERDLRAYIVDHLAHDPIEELLHVRPGSYMRPGTICNFFRELGERPLESDKDFAPLQIMKDDDLPRICRLVRAIAVLIDPVLLKGLVAELGVACSVSPEVLARHLHSDIYQKVINTMLTSMTAAYATNDRASRLGIMDICYKCRSVDSRILALCCQTAAGMTPDAIADSLANGPPINLTISHLNFDGGLYIPAGHVSFRNCYMNKISIAIAFDCWRDEKGKLRSMAAIRRHVQFKQCNFDNSVFCFKAKELLYSSFEDCSLRHVDITVLVLGDTNNDFVRCIFTGATLTVPKDSTLLGFKKGQVITGLDLYRFMRVHNSGKLVDFKHDGITDYPATPFV